MNNLCPTFQYLEGSIKNCLLLPANFDQFKIDEAVGSLGSGHNHTSWC